MMTNQRKATPTILAEAKFSEDMVGTLTAFFKTYEDGGVVTIEVTDHGLWLKNPIGGRQFLGSTTVIGTPYAS